MSARPLLTTMLTLCCVTPLLAQPAAIPFQGSYAPPMYINTGAYADPYATVTIPATPPVFGTVALPTSDSLRDRVWFRTEFLSWRVEGMDLPPLITTSTVPTPINQAGVLGAANTSILFGLNEINDGPASGFRYQSGYRLRSNNGWSIESEFFKLKSQSDGFLGRNDGTEILALPYFNVVTGQQASRLLSYPGVSAGAVSVSSKSKLGSYMLVGRVNLNPNQICTPDGGDRVDYLIGYRYLEVTDRLQLSHDIAALIPANPDTRSVVEQFDTKNKFNGLQLGVTYMAQFRRAWVESMIRVGVGSNRQQVRVFGSDTSTDGGVTTTTPTGFLTQRTNIQKVRRNQFTMIPEVGLTFGYRFSPRFHGTLGYSVLYFPNVVRASDQIDTDLNPNFFAPEAVPLTGALRPRPFFRENSFYAHGLNIGGEFRF